ncbi:EAL domain-containing protein [Bosea sp. (in: a-proteobacteria)]|uniref:putative bifunctional diguanylate cyclase/phosphodiesterase n=1 Tax=Bosea sp. (in: a-proteobacteria) TaxID=1871050 RepID=UPI001AC9D955|nr:EAL domain-containing protein [Bosea sp. (in: a-proteobacteria)]MBN9435516.1 EAL domain-containing protein [Bosea sp. (in: a-proteobacteria)]
MDSVERLQSLQNATLEAIARGEQLAAIMLSLCLRVEAIAPDIVCSVVAADAERRLQPLAAPSLPASYSDALRGAPSGPRAGSCGTAIHRGCAVEVTDIATDPLWQGYEHLVLPLGLRACWSSPIKARDGRVVGSFAFYYRSRRGPDALERRIVATCVHLCAIAIEHDEVRARNHQLAYFDSLTGLPNRAQFNDAIARMTASAEPRFALLLIDIDHLKAVNDTMGHATGDRLIETVAARLAKIAGTAFRIGGDEFAVLLPDCGQTAQLRSAANGILTAMPAPFDYDGNTIIPSVTIGAALAGADGSDSVTLRQNADFALYHAKETRRGRYVRFKYGLRTTMMRRVQIVQAVGDALAGGRVLPHYQPVVRLDTGEVSGVEALARMRLDDGRIVAAGEFHEAMLDPKIAYRISGQMLAAVTADMANWRRAGLDLRHVGINFTTADFQKGDLVQRITRACERAQLPLDNLVVEITEQVIMGGRRDGVARTMEALRERGIQVALDDFGTGFASLTHLLDFPVDIIKIDRSFIGGIEAGARSSVIVEALVGIANRLRVKIVAEGIETSEQFARLRAMGCDLGQGYLFSRAVAAEDVPDLIRELCPRKPAPRSPTHAATAA